MALTEETRLLIRLTAEDATKQAFSQIGKSLNGLATTAAKVAAVVGSALAFKEAIDTTRTWNRELDLLVDTLGATGEEAARLNYIGRTVGLTAQDTASAFGILSRKLAEQQKEIHQGISDFDRWGVRVTDSTGRILAFEDILSNVNTTIGRMPAGLAKTAALMDLFGRAGAEMNDLVSLSREQIAGMVDDVDKLGLSMSSGGVAAAAQFERQFNRLGLAFDAFKITIGNALMPLLSELISRFVMWAKDVLPRLRDTLGPIVSGLLNMAVAVFNLFGALGRVIGAIVRLVTGQRELGNVTKVVTEALRRITSILKEVADAADRFADLIGEKGVVGALQQLGGELLEKSTKFFGELGVAIGDAIGSVQDWSSKTLPKWVDAFGRLAGDFSSWLVRTGIPSMLEGFSRLPEFLLGVFSSFAEFMGNLQYGWTLMVQIVGLRVGAALLNAFIDTINAKVQEQSFARVLAALGINVPLISRIDVDLDVGVAMAHLQSLLTPRTLPIHVLFTEDPEGTRILRGIGVQTPAVGGGGQDMSQRRGEQGGGTSFSSEDRPATIDDVYAAYTRNHGTMPEFEWAQGMANSGLMWSQVQGLAKGGIVTRPTRAIIGEAGPEAVIPLERGRGMGTTVINHITLSNNIGLDERKLAQIVSDEILKGMYRVRGIGYGV